MSTIRNMNVKNKRTPQKKLQILILLLMLISGCTLTVGTTSTTSSKTEDVTSHYVRRGENLFRISKYYYGLEKTMEIHRGIDRIKKANSMNEEKLSVGQKLLIPGTDKKQPSYALTPPVSSLAEPFKQDYPEPPTEKMAPETPELLPMPENPVPIIKDKVFLWPVTGKIICNFGELGNQGIDIAVDPGKEIVAADNGKVVFAGMTAKHQETVVLEHLNGIYTIYGHDMEILIKQGDNIARGETIARIKSGTHRIRYLHFEIRIGTVSVNPLFYLPERDKNGT